MAAAGLTALAYVGFVQGRNVLLAGRLPDLPDLSASAAIAEHLREADRAARADPASPSAVGALCIAYHADLFYDQAERCYVDVEALAPDDWRWPYLRALARGDRGDSAALVEGMRRVVVLAPDLGTAWWRIADAELKAGQEDEAAEAFRRARAAPEPARPAPADRDAQTRQAPVPLAAYADLGLARLALLRGDAAQAEDILLGVAAAQPTFGPAFRLLAETYRQLGRSEPAERAQIRADRLPPYVPYADPMVDLLARETRSSTFLLQQAAAGQVAIDPDWTEFLLRRALAVDPDNPDVVLALGQLLRGFGRHEQALELFRKHYAMVPDDPQALGQVGVSLMDLGRVDEAEAAFREVLGKIDDPDTHYNLGTALAGTGRLVEAAAEFEQTLALEPNRADARFGLAVALIRQGALGRAIAELERVIALEPDNDAAHTNLGLALLERKQVDRAVEQFREALRINPSQPQAQTALRTLGAQR